MAVAWANLLLGAATVLPMLSDAQKSKTERSKVTAGSEYADNYASMAANRYSPAN